MCCSFSGVGCTAVTRRNPPTQGKSAPTEFASIELGPRDPKELIEYARTK